MDALNGAHVAGRALPVNAARPLESRREPAHRAGKLLRAVAVVREGPKRPMAHVQGVCMSLPFFCAEGTAYHE